MNKVELTDSFLHSTPEEEEIEEGLFPQNCEVNAEYAVLLF